MYKLIHRYIRSRINVPFTYAAIFNPSFAEIINAHEDLLLAMLKGDNKTVAITIVFVTRCPAYFMVLMFECLPSYDTSSFTIELASDDLSE